ncbi:hypothetical protein SAMN05216466_106176 [Paraburkholderia phenazinium]|uniref:Ankyrin repeat-containing protein n=1 Tax=Paraburkholderia phenazinium TaxID=60549 RepID=A0A1G7YGB6_9BURK|nr:hypothetical protein [Paraburkholderia phenazinium]SDG95551.1 hypothetical protein SAMN05216466_106176 [Paraburkholderia phenazinium]
MLTLARPWLTARRPDPLAQLWHGLSDEQDLVLVRAAIAQGARPTRAMLHWVATQAIRGLTYDLTQALLQGGAKPDGEVLLAAIRRGRSVATLQLLLDAGVAVEEEHRQAAAGDPWVEELLHKYRGAVGRPSAMGS